MWRTGGERPAQVVTRGRRYAFGYEGDQAVIWDMELPGRPVVGRWANSVSGRNAAQTRFFVLESNVPSGGWPPPSEPPPPPRDLFERSPSFRAPSGPFKSEYRLVLAGAALLVLSTLLPWVHIAFIGDVRLFDAASLDHGFAIVPWVMIVAGLALAWAARVARLEDTRGGAGRAAAPRRICRQEVLRADSMARTWRGASVDRR